MSTQLRPRAASVIAALGLLALVACSSPDERARNHLARGTSYLTEGMETEARLEFLSALRFDPRSVEARKKLATLALERGSFARALQHMQEAHRLDPTDSELSLQLASLLQGTHPDRAKELIEEVIRREPENGAGYIGRSNFALNEGRTRAAGFAARKAMKVAPDDPRADWNFARVLQVMIREGQLSGKPVEDSIYQSAVGALERYIQKGGESPWSAQLEQARIMAAWVGHSSRAAGLFRAALENAVENGSRHDQLQAAARVAAFATSTRFGDLYEEALRLLVDLEPRDYATWRRLSDHLMRSRRDPEEPWRELLRLRPADPKAHVEYARFLVSQFRLDEALAYLAKKADEGIDPPVLRAARASTQIAAGRVNAAKRTVRRLERDHPTHSRTILERAQLDIREGKIRLAGRNLRRLAQERPDADAQILLARVEMMSGDTDAALTAVDEAIHIRPTFAFEAQHLRARLLADKGEYRSAIESLNAIRDRRPLSPEDLLLLARCRYETGMPLYGHKLLEELLSVQNPLPEAVVEYAQREGDKPQRREIAKRELGKLLRRQPENWRALTELTHLDLADDHKQQALERLDRSFATARNEIPAHIRLLRAKVSAEAGREAGTIEDARAAFDAQPRLRGALEFLVALHIRKGEIDEALAAVEEADRAGAVNASRRVLLGRLYQMQGRSEEAVQTFEQALSAGEADPSLYYHLGMALLALDRGDEATRALRRALSISKSFPEARDAKRALEGVRSAGAS